MAIQSPYRPHRYDGIAAPLRRLYARLALRGGATTCRVLRGVCRGGAIGRGGREAERQRDKLQEEIERRMAAMQNIQNKQSNEAAEKSGAEHQTQYDSDMQQMMDKIASDMATNRDAYNSGMRDIKGMGSGDGEGGNGAAKGDGDKGRSEGAVTVSYNFDNPVRHHRDLYVPAYRARGGGIVVVDVWIDRNGTVTAARIASSTNAELNEQALAAARHRRTLFRIEGTAPTSHRGTITYTFVAQ